VSSDVIEYEPPDPLPGLGDVVRGPRPVLADISVVIPTLGRPILECALASMVGGAHWPSAIVVVDQSLGEDVARLLARVQAMGVRTRRVSSEPRGRAPALNLGVQAVRTPYLAITDDDCVVAPDWLDRMFASLKSHPDSIVSGRVEDVGDEESVANVLSVDPDARSRPSLVHDIMSGGNCGMPASVFQRVGPFDEDPRVRLAEDTEYGYRALRRGVRLIYAPEVRVWHYAWRDQSQRERQYRGYALSHGGFYGKYIRRGDLFVAARVIVHLARALRRWARASWRGDANLAAHGRAYFIYLIPGVVAGLRKPVGVVKR
jgi:GT2 family glycosyltransferase